MTTFVRFCIPSVPKSAYHPDWELGLSKITLTICSIRTLTCWLSKDVTELCHDSDCYLGSICPLGLKFDWEKWQWEVLHLKRLPQLILDEIWASDWLGDTLWSLCTLILANQKFGMPKEITWMHVSDRSQKQPNLKLFYFKWRHRFEITVN